MDAEAAPTPRVIWKKPSSGPTPRSGDDHQHHGPNPAPSAAAFRRSELKRRLRASAEDAALAFTAAEARRQFAAAVRFEEDHGAVQRSGPADARVDGGHGVFQGPGTEGARLDGAHGALQIPGPEGVPADVGDGAVQRPWIDADEITLLAAAAAFQERTDRAPRRADAGALFDSMRDPISPHIDGADGGHSPAGAGVGRGGVQMHWSDGDELTLLTAAVAFRQRTGREPRLPDMGALFDSISGSISPLIDQYLVYYKLKRLKSKFQHSDGPRDPRLRDLCSRLWGDDEEAGERDADQGRAAPDAAAMMPVVTEVLGEYWNTNGRALVGMPLEKGLSLLGKKEGRSIETRWRQQLDEEMQTQMRRHDLAKEVCALLSDAIKGLGP
ncbi:hypothetical protein ACP4OV_000863 [Aristida adscensionis]